MRTDPINSPIFLVFLFKGPTVYHSGRAAILGAGIPHRKEMMAERKGSGQHAPSGASETALARPVVKLLACRVFEPVATGHPQWL
jgi:hypothetical protein